MDYKPESETTKPSKPGPKPKPRTVKMRRPDGKEADVHPDMVESYRKGDYKEV